MKRVIPLVLIISFTLTGLSWFKSDWVQHDSLFLPPSGPDFQGHGMPWWYMRCYENKTCSFFIRYFVYDYLFWSIIIGIFALVVGVYRALAKKILLRNRN